MATLLTLIDLKRIALDWKNSHLQSIELDKANAQLISIEAHEQQLESNGLVLSDMREQFALNNYADLTDTATELLVGNSHSREDVQHLSYELATARIQVLEQQICLLKGKPVAPRESHQQPADNPISSDTTISAAFAPYCVEKLRNADWNDKTQKEQQYSIQLLGALLDDKAVAEISKADIRRVKDSLARLPKNTSKDKRFIGMSITEIIDLAITDNLISSTRANHHLRLMSGFLGWCQLNGYMQENPVTGMIPKRKRSARDERKQFDDADVLAVLSHQQVTKFNTNKAHQYWLPRLGMYTGARLEELCQLHTGDIKQLDGIHYLDINESRPDQQLKNLQSPRIIPLHNSLIDAGFVEYIAGLDKHSADGLVFPELSKTHGKYSHNVSKWFSRAAKHMGLEKGKTFHSYRHTMADKLRDQGAQDYVIKRILGHATQSETHDRYGSNKNVSLLAKAINRMSYY
ncbi:MAG: site-specific integrase [Pseudomonadales bacterium]|nr:site-specific integrase [Pseudomonadales bacterium]NRA14970.1 site-specific integrase [Oceanospirillaceae bacterium]